MGTCPRNLVEEDRAMYGPLIAAAAILFTIAALVLWANDVSGARSRRAIERIHQEGRRSKHW